MRLKMKFVLYCVTSALTITCVLGQISANNITSSATARKMAPNFEITFPGYEDTWLKSPQIVEYGSQDKGLPEEIPLSLLRKMNEAHDLLEFMNFVENATVVQIEGQDPEIVGDWDDVSQRFGGGAERNAGVPAKAANCQPENQTIPLVENSSPTVAYYPTCTRIERCGGCCTSPLLVCEPTKTETVLLQVIKTQYNGGSRMTYAGKETIEVERHLACRCNCRIKAEDCNQWQVYDESGCRCRCTNNDDRLKCEEDWRTKLWDSDSCTCRCRQSKQCSTGFYYDDTSCRCEPILSRRADVGIRAVYGESGRETLAEEKKPAILKKESEDSKEDKANASVQRVPLRPLFRWFPQQKKD